MIYNLSSHYEKISDINLDFISEFVSSLFLFKKLPKIPSGIKCISVISHTKEMYLKLVIRFDDFTIFLSTHEFYYHNIEQDFYIEIPRGLQHWTYSYAILRKSDRSESSLSPQKHHSETTYDAMLRELAGEEISIVKLRQLVCRIEGLRDFFTLANISGFKNRLKLKIKLRRQWHKIFGTPEKVRLLELP